MMKTNKKLFRNEMICGFLLICLVAMAFAAAVHYYRRDDGLLELGLAIISSITLFSFSAVMIHVIIAFRVHRRMLAEIQPLTPEQAILRLCRLYDRNRQRICFFLEFLKAESRQELLNMVIQHAPKHYQRQRNVLLQEVSLWASKEAL